MINTQLNKLSSKEKPPIKSEALRKVRINPRQSFSAVFAHHLLLDLFKQARF